MNNPLLFVSVLLAVAQANLGLANPKECLGRLTFDQPAHFEWAVAFASIPLASEASISDNITIPLDRWDYNRNTRIMVSEATHDGAYTSQPQAYYPSKSVIKEALNNIEISKRMVKESEDFLAQKTAMKANNEKIPSWLIHITKESVEDTKRSLKEDEAKLEALKNYKIPATYLEEKPYDAFTVSQYNTQRLFVWREPRVYMFYISNLFKPKDNPPATLDDAKQLLTAFTPRTLGNVPAKTGFCFPYGFISDSGKEPYQIKNSFRFTDQPNVVYTLNTGTDRYYLLSQPASQGLNTRVPKLIPQKNLTPW